MPIWIFQNKTPFSYTLSGLAEFGFVYLRIKSYKISSESLKSVAAWSLAYLWTLHNVSL
jgi:hypothetical protein